MKKVFIVLSCIFIFTVSPLAVLANNSYDNSVSVYVDGRKLNFDVPPTIENGRTLVPLRAIFEALGTEVKFDPQAYTVIATKNNVEIVLPIGKYEAIANEKAVKLDVPAKIVQGRTLVPVRFVSEALGATVEWDIKTYTVFITSLNDSYSVMVSELEQVGELPSDFMVLNVTPLNDGNVLIDGVHVEPYAFGVFYFDTKNNTVKSLVKNEDGTLWGTVVLHDDQILVYDIKEADDNDYLVYSEFNPKTGEVKELVSVPYYGGIHQVSSQKEIVYDSEDGNQSDIFKVNLKGEIIQLTDTQDIDESWPSWSPDGRTLAYIATPKNKEIAPYITLINADGTQKKLTYPVDSASAIEWSPDGKVFAYINDDNNDGGLWLVKADGTEGKRILSQEGMSYLIWCSDGARILVSVPYYDSIFILDQTGSNLRKLYQPNYPAAWGNEENLIYVKKGTLYLWDLAKEERIPLLDGTIEEFWLNGDDIYCISQNQIWKAKLNRQEN